MMTGFSVSDAMTENPLYVFLDEDLASCAHIMRQHNIGSLLVKEGASVVGICTEQDIVRKLVAENRQPSAVRISEIMDRNIKTVSPDKDIFEAVMKMREYNVRHLPVVRGSEFVGLLTLKDILKIEPQLFDMLVDKIDLREEDRKPVRKARADEGICPLCGNYSDEMKKNDDGVAVCGFCMK